MTGAQPDELHGKQGYDTHGSTAEKGYAIIQNPQKTPDGRQKNSGDVIDGKAHGHAGGNIPRISDFLEIGSDGDGKIKENMIENKKSCHDPFETGAGIGDEYENQTEIFKGKDFSLPMANDAFSDDRAQVEVDDIIDDK